VKYRIKEYNWYGRPKFHIQWKMFGLFWVNSYDVRYSVRWPVSFDTLEDAAEYIKERQHNNKVKPLIHEVQN
jgi:hypothetical protein